MEYFTIAQASEKLNLSKSFLYSEIRAGRLKAVKRVGRTRGYHVSDQIIKDWEQIAFVPVEVI